MEQVFCKFSHSTSITFVRNIYAINGRDDSGEIVHLVGRWGDDYNRPRFAIFLDEYVVHLYADDGVYEFSGIGDGLRIQKIN